MPIDIKEAKETFKKYISNYNPEDPKIRIKITHIERVSRIAKQIAENLKLPKEEVDLAELIGLLHDIGRFEQIKQYHTFIDKNSINHGEYGVKILFENQLIREFIKDDKYDRIIKLAILNHNKAEIEKGLTDREILHAKIIRDADKLDIFYILTVGDKKAIWEKEDLSNEKISDEIYREFKEDKVINYKNMKTSADLVVAHFAYIYDLNFETSKNIVKENSYIDKIYDRFKFNDKKTKEEFEEIYKLAKQSLK